MKHGLWCCAVASNAPWPCNGIFLQDSSLDRMWRRTHALLEASKRQESVIIVTQVATGIVVMVEMIVKRLMFIASNLGCGRKTYCCSLYHAQGPWRALFT
eukprot:1690740-Amphidinium_carterae.3